MDILIVGSGGREHAIARKIAKNSRVKNIYCTPGNGGTAIEEKCQNINIDVNDISELKKFAKEKNIYLTIVGPEDPLTKGIVDEFKLEGLSIFGPGKDGAKLEGSKSYSKEFMDKYGVKTAKYKSFESYDLAKRYLEKQEFPIVIKADGLAAGKGVYICANLEEGNKALADIMIDNIFGEAGSKLVIEEYLEGVEASILSITDGKTIKAFMSAKDHKQILDGGKGPNTGGMGVIAPNDYVTKEVFEDFKENIMDKTLLGIKKEVFDFKGIIFFGIMITKKGAYLLEYNVRMGDPETQSVLELMDSDFLEIIEAALDEKLSDIEIKWKKAYCCNVVLASGGYPGNFKKDYEINFNHNIKNNLIFAGAKINNNKLVTSGGRVLSVLGIGTTKKEAKDEAYKNLENINFDHMYFRKDIGE